MGAAYVKALDKSGKTIDTDELYTKLKSRLDELSPDDPEQAKVLKSVKGFLSEIVDLDKRNLKVIKDVGKRTPQEKGETALARQVAQARTKLVLGKLTGLPILPIIDKGTKGVAFFIDHLFFFFRQLGVGFF